MLGDPTAGTSPELNYSTLLNAIEPITGQTTIEWPSNINQSLTAPLAFLAGAFSSTRPMVRPGRSFEQGRHNTPVLAETCSRV